MDSPSPPPPPQVLEKLPRAAQWALLLVVSVLFGFGLELARLPAALLIGPMLAAIIAGTNGATIRVPRPCFAAAQGMVGCLIATSITTAIFLAFFSDWPLFSRWSLLTLVASQLSRLVDQPLEGAARHDRGVGLRPGGATAMVLMADAFGADERLVAFMQYLRVIFVSIAAALIARLWVDSGGVRAGARSGSRRSTGLPSPRRWPSWRSAASPAVLPACRHPFSRQRDHRRHRASRFGVPLQLPPWLLAVSYAVIGWTIGLNFTRTILSHAARALPQIVGSILALMAFCGGLALC